MSSSAVLDADASRPRSGILTPSSEGSLNRHDAALTSESRKRKRADSIALEHLLRPSIAIKPHPPNLQVQPRILLPLMILPRKYLPLASIDFSVGTSDFSGRLVESHIKILDLESRVGSAPSVLIARYDLRGTIFALERQENGLYVVCQLGEWVDIQYLKKYATAVSHERVQPIKLEPSDRPISTALTTPQLHHDQKKKQAAIEAIQSLVKKRARSESVSMFNETPRLSTVMDPKESLIKLPSPDSCLMQDIQQASAQPSYDIASAAKLGSPPLEPQHTAETIFDNVRTQYFEALYKSMGSLAYFAKGPLSRARSAFHLDLEANLNMTDLVDFLKSLVLTTVQIDQKYRQAVPDIITKMKNIVESSDEGRRRKRKPKKMKLGKDGLYPSEDEHVRVWWSANQPELKDSDAGITPGQIKSHTSLLRTRETQLQMILILEILALEPPKAAEDTLEANLPTLPGTEESQELSVPAPSKRRNKHNLPVLLDVHADRLTIWQSIASDEQLMLEDSQAANASFGSQTQQKASSEPLKDFCVDVIIPFFSARLPTICDSINRKLGGPMMAPPSKSKSRSRQSTRRDQKPGAATKRIPAPNAPRTLQRALSTEQQHRRSVSRGPSNMIALMRSATSTTIPSFKREGSESVVGRATPTAEQRESQIREFLPRSSSMASLEDAKAKKKAMVEAELKDAISALRKPNRDVVGKALAEAAERRATSSSSAKKVKKPARSGASAIQVKATPANKRFKDMLGVSAAAAANSPLVSMEELIPPSSIGTLVPSTAPRRGHWDAIPRSISPSRDAIVSTPMKPFKHSNLPQQSASMEPAIPDSSPVLERNWVSPDRPSFSGGPMTPLRRLDFTASRVTTLHGDLAKDTVSENPLVETSVLPESKEKPVSIYQKLGWDDELDDLL